MRSLILFLATMVAFCNSLNAQPPFWLPTNGLVVWYPFNGNANDESNNSNNGTTYTTTLAQDRFGNNNSAYSFNGINSHIEIPDAPSLRMKQLTLSAWIKPNTMALMQLFSKTRITDAFYEAYFFNTNFEFGYKHNSVCSYPVEDWDRHVWGQKPIQNQWQFVTVTYDGNIVKGYINGQLKYTKQGTGLIDSCTGGNLRLGYNWHMATWAYNGLMDDIAIYNRAIDECEIEQLYTRNATTIADQPHPQTTTENTTVQFAVTSQGSGLTYTWQENAGTGFTNLSNHTIYSGANSNILTITNAPKSITNNLYRCIVSKIGSPCRDTSIGVLLTIVPLGISDVVSNIDITAYPNPSTDKLNITTGVNLHGKRLYLLNEVGQAVLNSVIDNAVTTLSIQHLNPGIYYLRAEGHMQILKIVKI